MKMHLYKEKKMKKYNYLKYSVIATLLFSSFIIKGQEELNIVLQSVAENSTEIAANAQYWSSERAAFRTDLNPSDPEISYGYFPGKAKNAGVKNTWGISQSFDFPTVYINKNRLANIKTARSIEEENAFRQQILLEAKQTYIEAVVLNQLLDLLKKRAENMDELVRFFEKKMEQGAATRIEMDKAKLQRISLLNIYRMKQLQLKKLESTLTRLNGGVPIEISSKTYFAEELISFENLLTEVKERSPEMLLLRSQIEEAESLVKLNKSAWMPSFTVSFEQEKTPSDNFRGAKMGMRIPLWSKRNSVKQAKAQKIFAEVSEMSLTNTISVDLKNKYDESVAIKESVTEYGALLNNLNTLVLLKKSLEFGEINMLQYLQEESWFFSQFEQYIELQKNYYLNLAELYKYRL